LFAIGYNALAGAASRVGFIRHRLMLKPLASVSQQAVATHRFGHDGLRPSYRLKHWPKLDAALPIDVLFHCPERRKEYDDTRREADYREQETPFADGQTGEEARHHNTGTSEHQGKPFPVNGHSEPADYAPKPNLMGLHGSVTFATDSQSVS
jgi:hypothetical protein